MAAEGLPVLRSVLTDQRRSLVLWSLAVGAVSAMYLSFYPAFGDADLSVWVEDLPDGMVEAFGYDQIGTAAGYLAATVYGLLGPALLLVFGIGTGARLFAGREEDGTLELELTAPISRRHAYLERLAALWLDVGVLVAVVTVVVSLLVVALGLDVDLGNVLAGSSGLLLLVLGFATTAMGVGAATGRRAVALAVAATLAVTTFLFDAIGPSVDVGWMTAVSPWSWYLGADPLLEGFDGRGLALLATIPPLAAALGWWRVEHRDLMV